MNKTLTILLTLAVCCGSYITNVTALHNESNDNTCPTKGSQFDLVVCGSITSRAAFVGLSFGIRPKHDEYIAWRVATRHRMRRASGEGYAPDMIRLRLLRKPTGVKQVAETRPNGQSKRYGTQADDTKLGYLMVMVRPCALRNDSFPEIFARGRSIENSNQTLKKYPVRFDSIRREYGSERNERSRG